MTSTRTPSPGAQAQPDPEPEPTPVVGGRPGRRGKVWGIVLIVLGVFPLLAGTAVVAAAIKNAQRDESNPEFVAKAWHNLSSEQLFPAHLEDVTLELPSPGWTRQGILGEGSCKGNLQGRFRKQAESVGCRRVMAATYTDDTGKTTATVALVVTRSPQAAEALATKFYDSTNARSTNDEIKPPVKPLSVPKTPAAKWQSFGGDVREIASIDGNPYVVAVTAGPTDLNRDYGSLPGDWFRGGPSEIGLFAQAAEVLASTYSLSFPAVIDGKEKSWGA